MSLVALSICLDKNKLHASYDLTQGINMAPDNQQPRLFRWLLPLVCSVVLAMITPDTLANATTQGNTPAFPPSVELQYVVRVKITAMSIGGQSTILWDKKADAYTVTTSARGNALGQVLISSSQGHLTSQGLQPDIFKEKRLAKNETTTQFDRKNNALIFSDSQKTVPLEENVLDRASIAWQLVFMARAHPEKFSSGEKITLKAAGRKGIDLWHFTVTGKETLQSPMGEIETLHLKRQDAKGKTTEVWLAPRKEWYPVKMIFDDNKNFRLEQIVKKITEK
jgi:hypothetical protein